MKIMLDIFSGRPNPAWELTRNEARELCERFAQRGVMPALDDLPILGFRGMVVESDLRDAPQHYRLPSRFRIAPPQEYEQNVDIPMMKARKAQDAQLRNEEVEAAMWLLQTVRGSVQDEVLEFVQQELKKDTKKMGMSSNEQVKAGAEKSALKTPLPASSKTCKPFISLYRPYFWNYRPIRLRNNCYNYAINFVSNSIGQPGRYVGKMYTKFECENVKDAAMADGCLSECRGEVRVVALAVWPGFDFHWYRLQAEKFWGHKLGIFSARNVDNRGRVIGGNLTPENCDRGPYQTFCGYYYVPLGMMVL